MGRPLQVCERLSVAHTVGPVPPTGAGRRRVPRLCLSPSFLVRLVCVTDQGPGGSRVELTCNSLSLSARYSRCM